MSPTVIDESSHKLDELKAVELVYALALSYSTSFNTVGAAVVFGLFSLLLLLSSAVLFSPLWGLLSLAYSLTVLTGVYFYLRAIRYSMMATEAARRLGILELTESIYVQSAGNMFIHKIMTGKFAPYGKFTSLYVIAGPIVLFSAVDIRRFSVITGSGFQRVYEPRARLASYLVKRATRNPEQQSPVG